jgi:PAS domain S-box-containing protein
MNSMAKIRSALLRYGSGVLAFAAIVAAAFSVRSFFHLTVDPTILLILVVIASAWYAGRWPALLVVAAYELTAQYFFTGQRLSASFVFVVLNRLVVLVSLVLFVSSRRTAQDRIQEQRERLRVSLSSIGDGVIATDTEGLVTFINPTAEALTGWVATEAVGRPLAEIFRLTDEGTRRPVETPIAKALREGTVVGLANHSILTARDGREIPIDDSAAPIMGPKGQIIGVILVFHDITARKQAEREREHLLERERAARVDAETASRLKDEFLATVSHELRTPLNAIYGWASVLRGRRIDEATMSRALESIERNARAQTQLVEDLLDVSRIITGRMKLKLQPVDISSVIRACIESIDPAAEVKNLKLNVEAGQSVDFVSADPDRLQQVIWNLLSNAVKFTPMGGSIDIIVHREGEHVKIAVRDTGEGIPPEFLPYVFDRFRQADASTTRKHGGLGLGLAIVRQIVELHGGSVEALSDGEGCGATFVVSLPVIAVTAGS